MGYKAGNETLEIEFETSGMTSLKEFLADMEAEPQTATFSKSCPETANYELDEETDDRKPLCLQGKKVIVTSRNITISCEGAFDDENEVDKFLHQNFLKYTGGIVRITDYLSDKAKPQVYVGYFDRTGLSFPRSGGETATYTYEATSGEFVELTETV